MKNVQRDGSVLVLVIVALALMALVMFVLAEGANTMLFQADAAQCRAAQRNLVASGLAWAQSQVSRGDAVALNDPVELDSHFLSRRQATLVVRFLRISDGAVDARIETSCSKGRHTLAESQDRTIPVP
jgi:hypothetical protein